jgi:FkbM family methyltransferase
MFPLSAFRSPLLECSRLVALQPARFNVRKFFNHLAGCRDIWRFDNRWQLLLNRLLFRHTSLTVYKLHGREIIVDHDSDDANGTRQCLVSPMYRRFLNSLQFPAPIDVLDLGANGGGFALLLLEMGITLRKIVCVEMNPLTSTRAHLNVSHNVRSEYKVINAAVCGTSRELELTLGSGGTAESIYQRPENLGHGIKRTCLIQGITLDDIARQEFSAGRTVSICKMDVEGAEFEIFFRPGHELIRRVQYLIIEVHPDEQRKKAELMARLQDLNFTEMMNPDERDPHVHMFQNNVKLPE